jgi:hypothetical protein
LERPSVFEIVVLLERGVVGMLLLHIVTNSEKNLVSSGMQANHGRLSLDFVEVDGDGAFDSMSDYVSLPDRARGEI